MATGRQHNARVLLMALLAPSVVCVAAAHAEPPSCSLGPHQGAIGMMEAVDKWADWTRGGNFLP